MNTILLLEALGITSDGYFPPQELSIKSSVIAQKYCEDGLPYDVAISWLQKAIRRGKEDEAMYCAAQIGNLKGVFLSHLLNRLVVIASEDIGCANSNAIVYVSQVYFEALEIKKRGDDCNSIMRQSIMKLVMYLSESPKSREVDWIIHLMDGVNCVIEPNSDQNLAKFRSYLERGNAWDASRLAMASHKSGLTCKKQSISIDGSLKRRKVFNYWKIMIESNDKVIYQLYRLFCKRYDLLQLIHAVLICCGYSRSTESRLDMVKPMEWDDALVYGPTLLDVAVDRHTHIGRSVLGRGMKHFILEGCKLKDMKPIYRELEHISMLEQQYDKQIVSMVPYTHQTASISELLDYVAEGETELGLYYPCGMGKTIVSMCFYKEIIELFKAEGNHCLTCIVIPKLELLKQFISEWSNYLTNNNMDTWIYINASIKLERQQYHSKYIHWDMWQGTTSSLKCDKIVLTTYASLSKLSGIEFDLVIYDEAHRKTESVDSWLSLDVTATPKEYLHKSVTFGLDRAIEFGYLSNYKMQFSVSIHNALAKSNKLIIYCKTIAETLEYQTIVKKLFDNQSNKSLPSRPVLALTSKQKTDAKTESIELFRKSRMAVMVNCRILVEGIDVPDCDGVYLTYNTKSEILLMQTLGRAIRKSSKKPHGMYMFAEKQDNHIISILSRYDHSIASRLI